MPARHTSLKTVCFSKRIEIERLWSTKEGVGETSGQTAGSTFGKVRFSKPVWQKKRIFLRRCGIFAPQFHRAQSLIEIWS